MTERRLCSIGSIIRKKNFAKVNTREMFNAVDTDNNGKIDLREWIIFWNDVKRAGHSNEEIEEELVNIRDGKSWVGFNDVNPSHTKD